MRGSPPRIQRVHGLMTDESQHPQNPLDLNGVLANTDTALAVVGNSEIVGSSIRENHALSTSAD